MNSIKDYLKVTAIAVVVGIMTYGLVGCKQTGTQPPVAVATDVAGNSNHIRNAASSITALGLTAIPKPEEADKVAREALSAIEGSVLPLLTGDNETAISNGVERILDLSVFDKPGFHKFKVIVSAAMPLLLEYVPTDPIDKAVGKIRPDTKAYLIAFFTGIKEGCNGYLGVTPRALTKPVLSASDYANLRKKLAE